VSGGILEQMIAIGGLGVFVLFFISIVWFVLCVVLFFKIWGMTDDVSRIKYMLQERINLESSKDEDDGVDRDEN
jgi:hypothetical protein